GEFVGSDQNMAVGGNNFVDRAPRAGRLFSKPAADAPQGVARNERVAPPEQGQRRQRMTRFGKQIYVFNKSRFFEVAGFESQQSAIAPGCKYGVAQFGDQQIVGRGAD